MTCQGADATTPAGLGRLDRPHPVQQQFADHDASQRGYCTPGQMCSAAGALAELRHGEPSAVTADVTRRPELSRREVAERMSGGRSTGWLAVGVREPWSAPARP